MAEAAHNMADSLASSHSASDLPIWEQIYRSAFPDFSAMVDHRQDGEHQRAGIDRSVILKTSKQILVDEKVRWRNRKTGKVYDDILLEYLSDEQRRVPGWVCKPLRADYIAYAIAPLGRGYLLPVTQLQSAWTANADEWIKRYRRVEADNEDPRSGRKWTTVSVPVPVATLYPEIGRALRVSFTAIEGSE